MLLIAMIPAGVASAAIGSQQFASQPLPTNTGFVLANGTDVTGIAVGTSTIYTIDAQTATGNVYKSIDGAQTFTKLTAPAAVTLTYISIAPDNDSVIAVTSGTLVYITSDAGSTWTSLPALPAGAAIMGVAVAPARSGTLLGREYFVALADPAVAAGTVALGDVMMIGNTASWATAAALTGTNDYIAVAVTPNFIGDRSVIALGIGAAAGSFKVQIINTANLSVTQTAVIAGTTSRDVCAAGTGAARGSIALPSDFDATSSSGRRGYVSIASNAAQSDNDVYRFDDSTSRNLSATSGNPVWSVAYAGTVSAGTLFEGRNTAEEKYSTDMTSSSPTWTAANKLQPNTTTNMFLAVAKDYATSKKLFLGTTGDESAFNVSTDAGITFNQVGLIDNGVGNNVVTVLDQKFTPDAKTCFVLTNDGTETSLWKANVPQVDGGYTRIFVWAFTAGLSPAINLSPDFATTNVIYVYDIGTAGVNSNIWRSADGGNTWNQRYGPVTGFVFAPTGSFLLIDANLGYVVSSTGDIYQTTNGAWTWTIKTNPGAGAFRTLTNGRTDELIYGGLGNIAVSKDQGTTWTVTTLNGSELYRVLKAADYTTSNLVFLGDATALGGKVYKFIIGTDSKPTDLIDPNAGVTCSGLALRAGVLYVTHGNSGAPFDNRISRAVNPLETPGNITWDTIDGSATVPAPAPSTALGAVYSYGFSGAVVTLNNNTVLFLRSNTAGAVAANVAIMAYEDTVAAAKVTITSPKDNSLVQVDPVTGRATQFNLVISPIGTGNGTVNSFDVEITTKDAGFAGATRYVGAAGTGVIVTNPTSPLLTVGPTGSVTNGAGTAPTLSASTVYQLRVRAANELSNDFIHSPWSAPLTVQIGTGGIVQQTSQGIQLLSPPLGAMTVGLTPSFSWAPSFGATEYEFALAAAPYADSFAAPIANVKSADAGVRPIVKLDNDRDYFWKVRVSKPVVGDWSTVANFHTVAAAVDVAPPIVITQVPAPTIVMPPQPTPPPAIVIPPAPAPITPAYIWAIIVIGAILIIAVIVLIVRTRRPV